MTLKTFFVYVLLGATTLIIANLGYDWVKNLNKKEEKKQTDEG